MNYSLLLLDGVLLFFKVVLVTTGVLLGGMLVWFIWRGFKENKWTVFLTIPFVAGAACFIIPLHYRMFFHVRETALPQPFRTMMQIGHIWQEVFIAIVIFWKLREWLQTRKRRLDKPTEGV